MIIKSLMDNESSSEEFCNEHGLSLYIETKDHKILFDTGASSMFIQNANKMGVDLSAVDLVIISHGHYDHGGGLKDFLKINKIAKIYISNNGFKKLYAINLNNEKEYIGLDDELMPNNRIVLVPEQFHLDTGLDIYSTVPNAKLRPLSKGDLVMEVGTDLVEDDFSHEQNLIITENGKTVLLTGCAHKGIVSIVDYITKEKNIRLDYVIGGFHLYNLSPNEDPTLVNQIGKYLLSTGLKYYTGHCTGLTAYNELKKTMAENIEYLSGGTILEL